MSYSEFTLAKVKKLFNLTTVENRDIYSDVAELECSPLLKEILQYNLPLALGSNSEKARSEMIIAPILVDLRRQLQERVNLFSGIDFNVDAEKGLTGFL